MVDYADFAGPFDELTPEDQYILTNARWASKVVTLSQVIILAVAAFLAVIVKETLNRRNYQLGLAQEETNPSV